MKDFLEELYSLSEKYGISIKQPIVNERINFFKQPSSVSSTSFSGTFPTYHIQELWSETTKELSIRFIKKTKVRVK